MTTGHASSTKTYLAVFGALMVLTVLTVGVSYLHLPIAGAVFVALVIAATKASLVAAFFMHLKGERAIIYGLLALTVVLVAGLYILPVSDSALIAPRVLHGEAPMAEAPAEHVP